MNRETIKTIVEVVTLIIALLGVPGYFYNQYSQLNRDRIERSLEYVRNFESGEVLDSRLKLIQTWSVPDHLIMLVTSPSNNALEKIVSDLVFSSYELNDHILRVANFFDTASKCMASETCDAETIQKFLAENAAEFCNLYGPYIKNLQNTGLISDTGNSMSELAGYSNSPHICIL